jgi:hypothetical protein
MLRFWTNMAMLGVESQRVIWLRMMKMAAGGLAARNEAALLVPEKVKAATHAGALLVTGSTPNSVVRSYRQKVRANTRRLSASTTVTKSRGKR